MTSPKGSHWKVREPKGGQIRRHIHKCPLNHDGGDDCT